MIIIMILVIITTTTTMTIIISKWAKKRKNVLVPLKKILELKIPEYSTIKIILSDGRNNNNWP